MLPGGPPRPWFTATPARRDFLSRLMSVLLGGPLEQSRGAALAWIAVEAAPAAAFAYPSLDGDDSPSDEANGGAGDSGSAAGAASQPAGEAAAGGAGGPAAAVAAEASNAQQSAMDWERARGAVKGLLSRQRQSAALFSAYAALEAAAGQHKAARRAYDAALAAAVGQV